MEPYIVIALTVIAVAVFLSIFIDVEDEELEPKCFDCANLHKGKVFLCMATNPPTHLENSIAMECHSKICNAFKKKEDETGG